MKKLLRGIVWLLLLGALAFTGKYLYDMYLLKQVPVGVSGFTDERHPEIDGVFLKAPDRDAVLAARQDISGYYAYLAIDGGYLNSPVWRGMSDYAMYRGGVTYKDDMEIGKGNLVILGHNMWDGSLFGGIHNTPVGNSVWLYDGEMLHEYVVYENRAGKEWEVSVMDDISEGEKPRLTLITCIGSYGTPDRRFVLAEYKGAVKPTVKKLKELQWDKLGS